MKFVRACVEAQFPPDHEADHFRSDLGAEKDEYAEYLLADVGHIDVETSGGFVRSVSAAQFSNTPEDDFDALRQAMNATYGSLTSTSDRIGTTITWLAEPKGIHWPVERKEVELVRTSDAPEVVQLWISELDDSDAEDSWA